MQEYVCYVALDWADQEHKYAWKGPADEAAQTGTVKNRPEIIQDWVIKLRSRFPEGQIAIVIEQGRIGLALHLVEYDFFDLYFVNPKCSARYREAFRASGAKDDPDDTLRLLDYLEKHRDQLRCWRPADELTRQLQMLAQWRRKLVDDRTQHTNQITSILKLYFPQALEWAGDLSGKQACDFLLKWSSLQQIQKSQETTIRKFYSDHHCRREKVIEDRVNEIKKAIHITNNAATIESCAFAVRELARQIIALSDSIERFDEKIKCLFELHPDRALYESLPGAGPVLEVRLAAALGTDRQKFTSAMDIQCLSVAPVTEQSGKYSHIRRRYACSHFEMQTWVEFAAHSIGTCQWAKDYYQKQRDRGKSRHVAIRALGYKWIRVIFRCWKDNVPYCESTYLDSLQKRRAA